MFYNATTIDPARAQFAFTVSFHFILPALSIGLASYLVVLEALWLRTGCEPSHSGRHRSRNKHLRGDRLVPERLNGGHCGRAEQLHPTAHRADEHLRDCE